MAITRAKATQLAYVATLPPQSVEAFKEGLGSVLRQWTALELAVFHQWGGPSSRERAEVLREELLDLFLQPDKVYKDDIGLILEDYLETEFNTILEDGSPDELGELFVTMWRECMEGNFERVTNILAKEFVRHEMVTKSQGLASGDIDDGSDDGADDSELNETVAEEAKLQLEGAGSSLGMIEEEEEEEANPPKLVDPEGWEVVDRSNKKNKRKNYKL
jgi:pre-rRNA-processing protein TSR2